MFVVNTTSATVGSLFPRSLPRNRVPSSRRRNPGCPRFALTFVFYGCFFGAGVAGAGAFFSPVAGAAPFCGAPPVGAGAAVVGAGVSGIAGFAPDAGALLAGGAVTGAGVNVWSSTDLGARLRVDASDKRNASPRNRPPHHQLALVSRLPV